MTVAPNAARTRRQTIGSNRRGSIAVLAAFLLVVVVGFVALSIDVGYMCLARSQAQVAADAIALAAGLEMQEAWRTEDVRKKKQQIEKMVDRITKEYAAFHRVGGDPAKLVAPHDVVFGRLDRPSDLSEQFEPSSIYTANAVQVTIRANKSRDNAIPLFFATVMGHQAFEIEATATVIFASHIVGVRTTETETITPLLPFTFAISDWRNLVDQNIGDDKWSYDPSTGIVTGGIDGLPEIKFYPTITTGGNWGTVDFNSKGNGTKELARQISEGVNSNDLADFGGSLELDGSGDPIIINGDTGVSSTIESDLISIIGQPRIIPLYGSVSGSGNNATYEIVGFAGVRVMDVNLEGSDKYVVAQPCNISDATIVNGSSTTNSDLISNELSLVR